MFYVPGNLYILSAPSGAGKSSSLNFSVIGIRLKMVSVSHTTRAPRQEKLKAYTIILYQKKSLNHLVKTDLFLEYAKFLVEIIMELPLPAIEENLAKGIDVFFLDIDWQGAQQIRKKVPSVKAFYFTAFIT